MDTAGRSAYGRALGAVAIIFWLLTNLSVVSFSQTPPGEGPRGREGSTIRELFEQQQWREIVNRLGSEPPRDPNLAFYYGSALAQLGRYQEARNTFLAARRVAPLDPRFPVEIAGIAFRQKRYSESASWLRRALRVDPQDRYANDFLGTVYFLQNNTEAALKYWNRIDKPYVESVRTASTLQIRPALLDHALTFSPADRLTLSDFLTSQKRVGGLGVFPSMKFDLASRDDGKFDVTLNLRERNGFGDKWEFLLSTFRGLPYQTVYLEYFNLGRSAFNFTSLVRWDAQKRRIAADFSAPLYQNPKWRYRFALDLRNENWQIRQGPLPVEGALNLRRQAVRTEIVSFTSGRLDWSTGTEISHRDYRSIDFGTTLDSRILLEGVQLKQRANIRYDLVRVPERRLILTSSVASQLARIWSEPGEVYAKFQGSLTAHWLPQAQADDYETSVQLRGGGTAGTPPFDELFMLGLERDNDLWLRAHIGTHDGRKGSTPLGDRYFLSNAEVDKKIYGNGLLSLKLSPFLDVGHITSSAGNLGSRKWLWDTGLQTKLRVLGVGLTFSYGKDLRTGNSVWYFSSSRPR